MTWAEEAEHFGQAGGQAARKAPVPRIWLQDEINLARLRVRCARAEQAITVLRSQLELYRGDPAAAQALDRAERILGWTA